jgi:hypothetical protein
MVPLAMASICAPVGLVGGTAERIDNDQLFSQPKVDGLKARKDTK